MADQLHSDSVLQNLQQILNDPLFWGAGIVVLTYAWLRFAQRPTGMAAQAYSDTDPAALARAFTTASRYRFMQCVYVALFALAYAGLVVVFSIPGLRAIAAEFAGVFGAELPFSKRFGWPAGHSICALARKGS